MIYAMSCHVYLRVASGSPAARAGVKVGDDLVGFNSRVMDDYDDIMALLPHEPR